MSDAVPVDLDDLDARDRWILESRIDREGDTEVAPLLVELLMERILFSSCPHIFLRSVYITQESRPRSGRVIFHKLCSWG